MNDPQAIEQEAAARPIQEIVSYLRGTLGQQITIYVCGLEDCDGFVDMRLRSAYQVARMLTAAFSAETAKAWLFGENGRLDGRAPASILHYARTPADVGAVVAHARGVAGEYQTTH